MTSADEIEFTEKFCRRAFDNLPLLLRSRRIGCFFCGYVFLYDGTEETKPMSLDGNCGMCPACGNFSLCGDAAGKFTQSELLDCRAYLQRFRAVPPETLPPAVRLYLACSANTGRLRQCAAACCLACGATFVLDPVMFYAADGEPVRDDAAFLCPLCLAPSVVPEEKAAFFRQCCQKIGIFRHIPGDGPNRKECDHGEIT